MSYGLVIHPFQDGAKVTPRAGHSGAVLGDIWYIVGGGNNVKGCTDLLAADLSGLPTSKTVTWHVVTSVSQEPRWKDFPYSDEACGKGWLSLGGE